MPASILRRLLNPRRLLPRWVGHNVKPSQVFPSPSTTAEGVPLLPWGFVSQSIIRERVAPLRQALANAPLTTLPPPSSQASTTEKESYYQTALLGTHRTNPEVAELFASLQADFAEGARQAYLTITSAFLAHRDFSETSHCSPDLSLFLQDVRSSYAQQQLVPSLRIHSVTARLLALRLEHGFLCDNRHFLGLMGKREAWHHFLVGAAGPEAALIQELNNEDFPRRLTAEVEIDAHETCQLLPLDVALAPPPSTNPGGDERGGESGGEKDAAAHNKHFLTFESDFVRGEELDWQVTNMNDVIKSPSLSSLLLMLGGAAASS